jgi:hypothetical protein
MSTLFQLSEFRRTCWVLPAVLLAPVAAATPPTLTDLAFMPLCAEGDRIALFAMANSNLGSHYVDATRFVLLLFDSATGKHEISSLGGLERVGEFADPEDPRRVVPGGKVGLAQKLSAWGTDDCLWLNWLAGGDREERLFEFRLAEHAVHVSFAGRHQTIREGWYFEPSNEIVEMTLEGAYRNAVPLAPDDGPFPSEVSESADLEERPSLVTAQAELATRTVFIFRIPGDAGESPDSDVLVALPKARLRRAKSWLVNAHALEDLHRQGRWLAAERLFEMASQLDPENPTPQYNLACALARQQKVEAALDLLEKLPANAALRAKIERDPDFEGVRENAEFAAFVATLPKS